VLTIERAAELVLCFPVDESRAHYHLFVHFDDIFRLDKDVDTANFAHMCQFSDADVDLLVELCKIEGKKTVTLERASELVMNMKKINPQAARELFTHFDDVFTLSERDKDGKYIRVFASRCGYPVASNTDIV